ncbi:MAG TPA: hypothetical protein VGJ26_17520 [Pirellulales bacterium]
MHKRIGLFVCILTLLTLTSCFPESKNSLTAVADAELDTSLVGLWTRDDADDVQYLHIGGEAEKALTAGADKPEPGLMRFLFTGQGKEDGRAVLRGTVGGRFFVSKLGDERFMNLVQPIEEAHPAEPAGDRSFVFIKYKVQKDELTVWFLSMQEAVKAIERGDLTGSVTREGETVKNVQLTGETKDLATFFQSDAGKSLFPDNGGKMVFRRLR